MQVSEKAWRLSVTTMQSKCHESRGSLGGLQCQQASVARYGSPAIQEREHVADHRGNIGDHGPTEFRFEGFGDRLRKPSAAPDVKSVRLGAIAQGLAAALRSEL